MTVAELTSGAGERGQVSQVGQGEGTGLTSRAGERGQVSQVGQGRGDRCSLHGMCPGPTVL